MFVISMRRLFWIVIAAASLLACESPARHQTEATAVTLDNDRLDAIIPALQDEVDRGLRTGFVAGIVTRDGAQFTAAVGMADRERGTRMRTDTRFRIASMTKPIVTAAIMQLADKGVLALSDPVSLYIPAFSNARVATSREPDETGVIPTRAPARAIEIRDLLNHTAGLGYVFDSSTTLDRMYLDANLFATTGSLAERIDKIAKLPLYADPGTEWRYSYATDVAGLVVEAASGMSLEAYLNKNLFTPLSMNDTEFFFDKNDFDRLAVVYEFTKDGRLARAGANEVAANLNEDGFGVISGGAGLVSSISDYLRFCQMMLRGGELGGVRVLSAEAVRQMMSDQLAPGASGLLWEHASSSFGYGGTVVLHPERAEGLAVAGEWGWSGLWDTWFVINPADGVAAVLLAQTQPWPEPPPSRAREIVKAAAYEAVTAPAD